MLRVGLTGGIGSGKSTAARTFAGLGATIVDADAIARQVLEPGTPGLAAVAVEFGRKLLDADGALDRAALADVVFADPDRLRRLEAITHPLIWAEAARQFAAAPADGVVVHDMPLLVEKGMSADYHLVVVVLLEESIRVERLVTHRGLGADDARARIRAQATDAQRWAAADVLLDNGGTKDELAAQAVALWRERVAPFADNLRDRRSAASVAPVVGEPGRAPLAILTRRVAAALGLDPAAVTAESGEGRREGVVVAIPAGTGAEPGGLDDPPAVPGAAVPGWDRPLADAGFPALDPAHPAGRGNADPGAAVPAFLLRAGAQID